MIAAHLGQLFIPIKRDKWLTGCVPNPIWSKMLCRVFGTNSAEHFFVLKNVFEFGNQGITQFLGGANLFEFSRGVVFWISPSWKTDSMDETLQGI